MNQTARLAREDAITDALRAVNAVIGEDDPTDQALAILAALKSLRDGKPARVPGTARIDYLRRVQDAAQRAWHDAHGTDLSVIGIEADAEAIVDTPLGELSALVWRRAWQGARGGRTAWASVYALDGEPITVAEIRNAGLAMRPTSRNRNVRKFAE
jgi:predicted outer membrane protein